MSKISNMDDIRNPVVIINDSLDKYVGKNLFPKKLALVNEFLAKAGMPEEYYEEQNRKPLTFREDELTPLQVELLRSYAFTPSEEQMVKLKAFLKELFPNKIEELQYA
jgi:transcriptional antiterminator